MGVDARDPCDPFATRELPGGVWRDGAEPLRQLGIRPVDESDHGYLLDSMDSGMVPSARATALLQRCLEPTLASIIPDLSVGDREALLLQLRSLTFGDVIDCILRCPAPACGKPMELMLRVSELLTPAYEEAQRDYGMKLEHEGLAYSLQFRLPRAADLDEAAALALDDAELAGLVLLRNCLCSVTANGEPVPAESLPEPVRDAVAAAMSDHDPQAQIDLELACPVCGEAFSAVFDTASYLLQELDERAVQTLRQVHILASHYGWSEPEVLQMPARRRTRYIELIAETPDLGWKR